MKLQRKNPFLNHNEEEKTFHLLEQGDELTLMKAITVLVDESEDSRLCDQFFAKVKPQTDYLAKRLKMTALQAIIFSIILEHEGICSLSNMSRHLDCLNITMLRCKAEIDKLVCRHYLRLEKNSFCRGYVVPEEVVAAIQGNHPYRRKHYRHLSPLELLQKADVYFFACDNDQIPYAEAEDNLTTLLSDNTELTMVRRLGAYSNETEVWMFLLYLCMGKAIRGCDAVYIGSLKFLFSAYDSYMKFRTGMLRGTHQLISSGMVERTFENGFQSANCFNLTDKAITNLLDGVELLVQQQDMPTNTVRPEDIMVKELFYPTGVKAQIDTLAHLLSPESYKLIHTRMRQQGLCSGFATLFYGAPGTGKTETVMQLARLTGRTVASVDIASIRDKYVGESEKRIKEVFDSYRRLVRQSAVAPILLFNECDAILGRRSRNGSETSVEKMEQSIQNIILQEMETLDGIMVCTTNLVSSFDEAFERRFLYKVEFTEPTQEARQHIWQALMPQLQDVNAQHLAAYPLTGGNIENITRKAAIDEILWGKEAITLDKLSDYCRQEKTGMGHARIGF